MAHHVVESPQHLEWAHKTLYLLEREASGWKRFNELERIHLGDGKRHRQRLLDEEAAGRTTFSPLETKFMTTNVAAPPATRKRAARKARTESTAASAAPAPTTPLRRSSRIAARAQVMAKSTPATATKTATGATKRKSEDGRAKQPSKKSKPTPAPARRTTKRKSDDEDEDNQRPVEKARSAAPRAPPQKVAINQAPSQKLEVYVFGEGANGELGLGGDGNVTDVSRPRLNPNLSAKDVGVVQIACGGMHVAALTHDNKILTWGVNDQKCLGRDTSKRSEEDEGDAGISNREATPTAVDIDCPEGTVWTQVAAGDSITVALTDEGLVYGCGTFRNGDGITGFSPTVLVQERFVLIGGLKKIVRLECGENHVLALDQKGNVFAWGSGEQNQLGRRLIERRKNGLLPRTRFGLPVGKVKSIACGAYHSFAIDESGKVWGWGLNNFMETGIPTGAGESNAAILRPEVVKSLEGKKVVQMVGGAHHSLAVTEDGECLTFGRIDSFQTGHRVSNLPDANVIRDEKGDPRILTVPTAIQGVGKITFAAAGSDNSIAISAEGKAFAWGYSDNYQTGLNLMGLVEVPTHIVGKAVSGIHLHWAGCGGQYSMLASNAA